MCGILGVVAKTPVNQLLYDGLLVLQHRGQDAAGIVTAEAHRSIICNKCSLPLPTDWECRLEQIGE